MDLSHAPPAAQGVLAASTVVDVPVTVAGGQPTTTEVQAMMSATMPGKRKRGSHQASAAAAAPAAAAPAAATGKPIRAKTKSAGPRGQPPSKAKKPTVNRVGLAPPPTKAVAPSPFVPSSPVHAVDGADKVFDVASTTSYMDMLNASSVDLDAGIGAFDEGSNYDYGDYGDDEEGDEEVDDDVVEVDPAAAGSSAPKQRTSNYTEIEDVTLVRAWGKVGMDACTGTDQTGKRYWQRIEDQYCKMKPRTSTLGYRSFRSLQGRWDVIKPCCARWSAAMDQVMSQPPSGMVESDYVSDLTL